MKDEDAGTQSVLTHLAAPTEVGFELLPYCNLRCFHCFSNSSPDQPYTGLSLRKIGALYDELVELQVFKIYLGGGEPFARRDILEIIELAVDRSLAVTISTNGSFLTERHLEVLGRIRPALIQISLDGASAETHDGIRGPGSFRKATGALKLLRTAGIRTAIGTVACQTNFQEIPDILQIALDLGVNCFHLMGLQPAGRAHSSYESQRLTENQWLFLHDFFNLRGSALRDVIDLQVEIEKFVLFKHRLFTPPGQLDSFSKLWCTCPCARRLCTIAANGDVLPCELMRDVIAGNVHSRPLSKIWKRSPAFESIRKRSLGIAACSDCPFWDCCQGGCAAATLNLTGALTGADPRCELANREISRASSQR
jgi:radical SAM protein with 4Fe4S-binding SPASM domain